MSSAQTKDVYQRRDCRLCGSGNLELAVPLRPTPVADAYVPADSFVPGAPLYALDLHLCRDCGHLQLLTVVSPEILFGSYTYRSGSSASLLAHFAGLAGEVSGLAGLQAGDLVVDVGSNDGSLLAMFQKGGVRVAGVDPAATVAAEATARGLPTYGGYMTVEMAKRIVAEHGAAKLVTANNVFAHADNLGGMARGIREVLAPGGWFTFEVSYLPDILDRLLFDTVYHEHLSYHAARPLDRFLRANGLALVDTKLVGSKGGSIRGIARRLEDAGEPSGFLRSLFAKEEAAQLDSIEPYRAFSGRIDRARDAARAAVKDLGGRPGGFGASATVTTLVYQFGWEEELAFLVDDNATRHGFRSPGVGLPVLSADAALQREFGPLVILAWQYATPIRQKHEAAFRPAGHPVMAPLPEVEVAPAEKAH
jgi:SAM-dependent methyltransferase